MSRISKAFANKKAFIGYLTAGKSKPEDFLALLKMGVNVLEVGISFSDPVADGVVIQKAMQEALAANTTPETALEIVRSIRKKSDVAIILFTYLNPIQRDLFGFLKRAKEAGVDGILIIDLPIEEYRGYCGLDPIFVISPSTPIERIEKIASLAKGFIYYACRKGTTGAREDLPEDLAEKVAQIKAVCNLPVAVGFGISSRRAADEVLKLADGVVVGSHFVEGKTL